MTASRPAPQAGVAAQEANTNRTLIVGLGSPILRDDAIGLRVAEALAARLPSEQFSVVEAGASGLRLLPLLEGWERVVIIDALIGPPQPETTPSPGALHRLSPNQLTSALHLNSSHDASLADSLLLGKRLGMDMPPDIIIFGVEVADPFTFDEEMTPLLSKRVESLADEIARQCLDS